MPCCTKVSDSGQYSIDMKNWSKTSDDGNNSPKRCPWTMNVSYVEKNFLKLLRDGTEDEILEYARLNSEMDLDGTVLDGQRALEIAVVFRSLSILQLLLSQFKFGTVHLRCAILEAIVENDIEMVEELLNAYEAVRDDMEEEVDAGDGPASLIPVTNVTPIMKAAILGNKAITRCLLDRGYTIKKPHYHRCACDECVRKNEKGERLSDSIARINAYRALTSPVYMILNSEDAILTAFQLSNELHKLAFELPEHQSVYQELSTQCSKFAADVLNQCCDTREVQVVLMQKKGFPDPRPYQFSRLRLAILYCQKEFVAHPSCQQVLRSMWVEGLPISWTWSTRQRLIHIIKHVLLFPFICIASVVAPFPFVKRHIEVPFNKFIYSATSYLLFLSLLLSTLLMKTSSSLRQSTSWNEVAVVVWILGHSLDLLINLCLMGLRTFLRSWWAVYDLVLFTLFLVAELLWFSIYLLKQYDSNHFPPMRSEWVWYHPYLIGEGIYAIASILAFMRLILWYQLHYNLGTLSISLRYMFGDVFRFLLLILIIMFAFMVGINSLYGDYQEFVHYNDDGTVQEQNEDFVTVKKSFKTVFWALFGMGSSDSTQLLTISSSNATVGVHHVFTEFLGSSLWGIYHIITVIVLINMLIAMLTESYQRVHNNADMEWKFARSSILLYFLDKQMTAPPPFNLIPTVNCITSIFKCLMRTFRRRSTPSPYNFLQRCCLEEKKVEKHESFIEDSYENLMIFLVHRYFHSERSRNDRSSDIPPDVMERLKADILEDLRRTLRKDGDETRRRSNTARSQASVSSASSRK